MPDITVQDLKDTKTDLEQDIKELLDNFYVTTGVWPNEVDLHYSETVGSGKLLEVVEISLEPL